jgi:aspartyl-tRNA(Asn)/glutamyl-tRNA(Gln) amidotransferase subunit B
MISPAEVERVRATIAELPAALRLRLQTEDGLSAYDADVIVNQGREVADYYREVARLSGDPKGAANWVTQHVLRVMNANGKSLDELALPAGRLAGLVEKLASGELPSPRARDVFDTILERGIEAAQAMADLGITAVDDSQLVALCQELLDANPRVVADVQGGKQQALGALVGQAKKKNPNADPTRVRAICLELIAKLP